MRRAAGRAGEGVAFGVMVRALSRRDERDGARWFVIDVRDRDDDDGRRMEIERGGPAHERRGRRGACDIDAGCTALVLVRIRRVAAMDHEQTEDYETCPGGAHYFTTRRNETTKHAADTLLSRLL